MKKNVSLWIGLLVAISPLLLSAAVQAAQDQALEITDVTYKSEDGTVASKLYRLKDLRARAPAIVVLPGRGRDFSGLEWLIKPLAQSGYAVMAIGYRGIPVRYYLKDVEDARNAITYLETVPYIDPSRIGIFGHSRGGMAALMTAASGDKRVRTVVAASAPTDHFKSVEEKKFSAAHYPDRMRTREKPPPSTYSRSARNRASRCRARPAHDSRAGELLANLSSIDRNRHPLVRPPARVYCRRPTDLPNPMRPSRSGTGEPKGRRRKAVPGANRTPNTSVAPLFRREPDS